MTRATSLKPRAVASVSDIGLCLILPVYAVLAWIVPERLWPAIGRTFGALDRKGSNAVISNAVALSGLQPRLPMDPHEIARALNAHRIESYFQYLRAYRPGGWKCRIVLEGEKVLRDAAAARRGVVLWVGHFVFNGIAPKKALAAAGYSVSHLSRPEHGFTATRFGIRILNPIRSRIEARYLASRIIIQRGAEERAIREAHRRLRQGAIVSITAGAWEGRQIGLVPIGEAAFPLATGAPALAHSTGSSLVPVFAVQEIDKGELVIRIVLGAPIEMDRSASRDEVLRSCLIDFARQQFSFVEKHPDQWRAWKYLQK